MPVPTALPRPRCQCLTSLSEPARKLAFEACSWRLWQPLPKTGKHHGMPVPTALPKPRCHCLTSLSEPAADCFGGRFRNEKIPSHAGPNGASEAPVPVLNVAFWARLKTSLWACSWRPSLSEPARKLAFEASLSEPAADCFGGRFRNGKTPWHAGRDSASEAPLPVPNVAFWAH